MKTIAFIVLILLAFCIAVSAAPFLTCDPQSGVEDYEVTIEQNGIPVMGGVLSAQAGGILMFDLEGIPNGVYNANVKAGNMWGWSDWSQPFGFIVERCNPPTGVLIIP